MSTVWPFKRIRILDDALVVLGGRPGFDTKVIVKPLAENHHYTISLRHGSNWLANSRIPIDIHKTYEGSEKKYESLGKGSLDLKFLTDRLMQNAKVDLREIDPTAPQWRNRRVLTIDERFFKLMESKELRITPEFAEEFAPVPVSKLQGSEIGLGIMMGKEPPGMLLKAADKAWSLGLPGFQGIEERIEEALDFDYLYGFEEDDDADEESDDEEDDE